MPKKPISINLLKSQPIGLLSELINWTLTIGRLLVIITGLIALGSFLYRFSLNREIVDVRSQVKQKQAVLAPLLDNGVKYRDLQERLLLTSDFSSVSQELHKIFKDTLSFVPQGIILTNIFLYKDRINISANAQSTSLVTLFLDLLKNYPKIQELSLDEIESKPSANIIKVKITATLKQSEFDEYGNIEQ